MKDAEIIVDGLLVPEGPVWCPDGTLVVTSVAEGALYRVWPGQGVKKKIADVQGGANSAALASDGGFIVTQDGGIDFRAIGHSGFERVDWPAPRYVSPGLQRVKPDGSVVRLVSDMQAPNDLVVTPDGLVYFTDPAHGMPDPSQPPRGRLMSYAPDGATRVVADGFNMINGVAREPSGSLIVTEESGLMRVTPDGEKSWIARKVGVKHATDGIALDVDGRIYMAASMDFGVRVIEDGKEVDFWPFSGEGLATNCCFGGPDNRWLFVTTGLPGDVRVFVDLPAPGEKIFTWPVSD
jgi:gluconolactonase